MVDEVLYVSLPWQELSRVELQRLSSLLQRSHQPLLSSWQYSVVNNKSQTQVIRDGSNHHKLEGGSYMKKRIGVRDGFGVRCNTERSFDTARA